MRTELWIRGLFDNRISEKNGKISGFANSFVLLHLIYYIYNYIRIVADFLTKVLNIIRLRNLSQVRILYFSIGLT